jgi:hypothetical protein
MTTFHAIPLGTEYSTQGNLLSLYPQENTSEKRLKVFYRNSKAQRVLERRKSILKNFRVFTADQASVFEGMFQIVYHQNLGDHFAFLSASQRVVLAFLYMEVSEKKICRNTGCTMEELRRNVFSISQKLNLSVAQLKKSLHSILAC